MQRPNGSQCRQPAGKLQAPHPNGGLGEVAQVGVHGFRAGDAQQGAAHGHPPAVAVADEEQEEVVRRDGLEDGCAGQQEQPVSRRRE